MPGTQFLLRGTGLEDLAILVERMDGRQTEAAIVTALQDRYAPAAIARTMKLLRHRQAPNSHSGFEKMPEPQASGSFEGVRGRVLCLANPPLGEALASKLPSQIQVSHRPFPDAVRSKPLRFWQFPRPENPPLGELPPVIESGAWDLVVCLASGQTYGSLAQVQKMARQAGAPCLFAYQSALGWELSPLPKHGAPCFFCAQQALFQSVFGQTPAFPAIEPMRSFPWPNENGILLDWLTADILCFLDNAPTAPRRDTVLRIATGTFVITHVPVMCFQNRDCCCAASAQASTRDVVPPQTAGKSGKNARFEAGQASGTPGESIRRIGIVGGGTAGYLTALALRAKHPELDICLIESPKVGVIGVGEATTPLMIQFLHVDLGLDIGPFFKQVQPTFKLGIRFDWGPEHTPFFHYPFSPSHLLESHHYHGDLRLCSLQAMLMTAGKLPMAPPSEGSSTGHWDCNLAYHLDNRRFVTYLQNIAEARGIHRMVAHVAGVETTGDGASVACLHTEDGTRLTFDLYIDCSGFKAILLREALGSPFISFDRSLFTDRALIANLPNPPRTPPYTQAVTMNAGWCWNTPQRDAHHCGYVFSSAFIDEAEAEKEMRQQLPTMGEARCIRFRSGRHESFWKGNVVAMGNAYGFVEPLESTALHMLIRQAGMLCLALPMAKNSREVPEQLNQRVGAYWDYLCWFLALHYRFNMRKSTSFWRACQQETDLTSYQHLLEAFTQRGPLSAQPDLDHSNLTPDPLWGVEGVDLLLMAMGKSCPIPSPGISQHDWLAMVRRHQNIASRSLEQNRALAAMDHNPQLLDAVLAPFRAFGPAFKRPIQSSRLE